MLRLAVFRLSVLFLLLGLCQILAGPGAVRAAPSDAATAKASEQLAKMPDEKVRAMLLDELAAKAAAAESKPATFADGLHEMQADLARFEARLGALEAALPTLPGRYAEALSAFAGHQGARGLLSPLLAMAVVLACSITVEALLRSRLGRTLAQLTEPEASSYAHRVMRSLFGLLFRLLFLAAFALAAVLAGLAMTETGTPAAAAWTALVAAVVFTRLASALGDFVFAPRAPAIRLSAMGDGAAAMAHSAVVQVAGAAAALVGVLLVLRGQGLSGPALGLSYMAAGALLSLVVIAVVWLRREPVRCAVERIFPDQSPFAAWLAARWHVLATLYVLVFLLAWEISFVATGGDFSGRFVLSLVAVPLYLVAVLALRRLTARLPAAERSPDAEHGECAADFADARALFVFRGLRLLLALALAFWLLHLWGLAPALGERIMGGLISICLTLILGYFAWQWVKAAIDRKIAEQQPDTDEDEEAETGHGGSREGTLLTIAKKLALSVIVVLTGLIVLAALGVNIGPLLAGAGIIGLAVGFGAQTLVKDLISGFFFLLDDAFRIGDYVSTAGQQGTVEHISIRSLRLRHHRGAIHTIPYGNMKEVTNYTRDWAIMKLELRLPFDTDVDKVRKIVKKVGKKLAADPELGPKFLSPVKSQGVKEISDSALIVRVKFTTVPGAQFEIRRTVYAQLQKKFAENGIEFAPKKVIVHVPDDESGTTRRAAAAAAQKVLQDEADAAAAAAEEGK